MKRMLNVPVRAPLLGGVVRALAAAVLLLAAMPAPAQAQCGPSIGGRFGGEATAVAQVNADFILVAWGTRLSLVNVSNPAAPFVLTTATGHFSSPTIWLSVPAKKISMTPGSGRAYVLLENGDIDVVWVYSFSPL